MQRILTQDRIIRQREVEALTGLSRVTIWRQERNGRFPKRRKISASAVGWLLSEIFEWMSSRTIVDEPA